MLYLVWVGYSSEEDLSVRGDRSQLANDKGKQDCNTFRGINLVPVQIIEFF